MVEVEEATMLENERLVPQNARSVQAISSPDQKRSDATFEAGHFGGQSSRQVPERRDAGGVIVCTVVVLALLVFVVAR
jgi:hypothetical protein